jgi:glyoxylase-like metal-dependent hydrolase (beta-lactamase superfamily II)
MRELVPGVYLIEGLPRAHAYVLDAADGWTLIDSGVAGDADQIMAQLDSGGYDLANLRSIVLTHAHSDHTGSVAELCRRSGASILAHQAEVPYIEQTQSLTYPSRLRRMLAWLFERISPTPPCQVDTPLQDGAIVNALGGLQVIHVPGHTPGSIALYQAEQRILFCGDAIFHHGSSSGQGRIAPPPRIFSVGPDQAEASARKLAALPVEVACFGHGEPILEGAGQRLREALGG